MSELSTFGSLDREALVHPRQAGRLEHLRSAFTSEHNNGFGQKNGPGEHLLRHECQAGQLFPGIQVLILCKLYMYCIIYRVKVDALVIL